jgi:transcription elongation GreA/GreB family factor
MTNLELKKRILDKCIEKQAKTINDLQKEIDEAQRMSNEYGQPKDRYDAFRTKLLRQRDMFAQQQAKANVVMNTLQSISMKEEFSKVEFGALIITDKQNIFVSAGLGKIEINGRQYFAVSPQVPIFQALADKKAGDEITFNGNKIKIKDIF